MSNAGQPENLTGKQIGGYEILESIGQGGMATVYKARQISMKRIVALKVLPRQYLQDDTYIQRFYREVEIVAQLEHRNIVPVHDFGEHDSQPYIAMRYMPAGSVDHRLANGALDLDLMLKIVDQIAPALDYAHGKGVLHRDLKPSNILMDNNGDAYLTDFGIARLLGENPGGISITTQNVVGTPAYMSPEQAQGKPLDSRSDIYALGVTLFEMTTGQRPFQADTPYGIAVLQVTAPTPSARALNPSVPEYIEAVIHRAMRKAPEERFRSAEALAAALRQSTPASRSVLETQPGIPRPTRPVSVRSASQPRPSAGRIAPPPAYHRSTSPPTPTHNRPVVPVSRPRRRRPQNLMMSAAIGGIIGCGLLTIVVIILALVLSNTSASAAGVDANAPAATQVDNVAPTLDATSEAARRALLGTPTPFR
jgi:serine/threonine protein kinase